MGEMKKKRARGRHACLPRARFFFHFAHLFPSACYAGYLKAGLKTIKKFQQANVTANAYFANESTQ